MHSLNQPCPARPAFAVVNPDELRRSPAAFCLRTSPQAAQSPMRGTMHCIGLFQAVCRRKEARDPVVDLYLARSLARSAPPRPLVSLHRACLTRAHSLVLLHAASTPQSPRSPNSASQHVPPRLVAFSSPTLSIACPAPTRPLRCPSTRATLRTTQSQRPTTLTRTTTRRARVEEQVLMRISNRDGAMAAHQ